MQPPTQYDWPHHQFRAMGGTVDVWLDVDDIAQADEAFRQAEELFHEVERALSRFDPGSELSQLNERSGQRVRVSKVLWHVLKKALTCAQRTGGLFDPTLQRALKAAGYDETFERVRTRRTPTRTAARSEPGRWQSVEMFAVDCSVRLPQGVELDFGGIGKGYTAGWAATLLGVYGPVLVDAAGDIAGGAAPRGLAGWPVGIKPPVALRDLPGEDAAFIWLRQAGLATSGVDVRRWHGDRGTLHHIIDPRTGRPAEPTALAATVLAPSLVEAEVLATASLIDVRVLNGTDSVGLMLFHSDGRAEANSNMREQVAWFSPTFHFDDTGRTEEAVCPR